MKGNGDSEGCAHIIVNQLMHANTESVFGQTVTDKACLKEHIAKASVRQPLTQTCSIVNEIWNRCVTWYKRIINKFLVIFKAQILLTSVLK